MEEVIPSKMADLKYKDSVWFDPEPVGMAMNVTSTGDAFNSVRISAQKSGKIIAEAEAKKTFASAVPCQFFCRRNRTNLCICLGNSLGSYRKLLRLCCFI